MKLWALAAAVVANRWLPLELYDYWHWQGERQPFLGDPEFFLSLAGAKDVRNRLEERRKDSPSFLFVLSHLNPQYKDGAGRPLLEEFAKDLAALLVHGLGEREKLLLMVFVVGEQSCIFYRGVAAKRTISDGHVEKILALGRADLVAGRFDAAFSKMVGALPYSSEAIVRDTLLILLIAVACALIFAFVRWMRRPRRGRVDDDYRRPGDNGQWPVRPTPFSGAAGPAHPGHVPAQLVAFSGAIEPVHTAYAPAQQTFFSNPPQVFRPQPANLTPFSGASTA